MRWLKYSKALSALRIFAVCFFMSHGLRLHAQHNTVLANGEWVKMAISKTGIYKLDIPLLRQMGFDPINDSSNRIKIYGNGGAMLPQKNNAHRPPDLIENAIWIEGENNGKLTDKGAVYFYAEGPHIIVADTVKNELNHRINTYSDTSFYFITFSEGIGKRIKKAALTTSLDTEPITSFDDYWYHEEEMNNLLRSGRSWWGEFIGSQQLSLSTGLTDIVTNTPIRVSASAIASATAPTAFNIHVNNQAVGSGTVGTVSLGQYAVRAQVFQQSFSTILNSTTPDLSIGIAYDRKGLSSAFAYLDYLAIQVKRSLQATTAQQTYYFFQKGGRTPTFQFKNATPEWQLWDITNSFEPELLSKNAAGVVSFSKSTNEGLQRFIGFTPDKALTINGWRAIANQNIGADAHVDFIIVTTPVVWDEARRLAEFRKTHDQIETLVVTTEQVYNQYSSGKVDVSAIRDFAKEMYTKGNGQLKYLLLFGDATYDYKNKFFNQTEIQRQSWVPVYESRESLNPIYTYSSDDYYGFLEDSEGEWQESFDGDHTMDIGVGRLPVKNVEEANIVVNKLIHYTKKESKGKWRNQIRFVADDGDENIHQKHAAALSQLIDSRFFTQKIFLDEFEQKATPAGEKSPETNKAIQSAIENGSLILNYTGHGGVEGWGQEQILTLRNMLAMRGNNNLPLLVTATCDFGRFDDPDLVSGGELMVLSPKGAAIGAISTTRPVFSSTNYLINEALYQALKIRSRDLRLGDILKTTKNNSLVGTLNRNFALLGDPSMLLISNSRYIGWESKLDTVSALKKVLLAGNVSNSADSLVDVTFNGKAFLSIYDEQASFETLGNEDPKQTYFQYRNKLFEGEVSVKNGHFVCSFMAPKNLGESVRTGRVSIYALDDNGLAEALDQLPVVLGGKQASSNDVTLPQIVGFINTPSFKSGDIVSPSSMLVVQLHDDSGINIWDSAGFGITATINDTLIIRLSDYYVANLDSFTAGVVTYPFDNLPSGMYTVILNVWDNYTNKSEITFRFQVEAESGFKLTEFNIFPNPFSYDLNISFAHNRKNEDISIDFKVYTLSGQELMSSKQKLYNTDGVLSHHIPDASLSIIPDTLNTYIYVFTLSSFTDNAVVRKAGRLIRSP